MRRIVAFGITAVALLMQPARAATGVITGYALDSGGRGLAGVCVVADDDAAGTSFSNYTDGDGVYAVSVAPGSYVVAFHDCSGAGYADQWWNNTPSIDLATPVTIADGQTANGIDAQLVLGGTLSGTVYDAGTAGLEGMCVDLESATDHVVTTTRESGLWGVSVPTGDYLVKFSDCDRNEHPWQWYDGKRVPDDADPIEVVPSGSVSNVNAHLTDNPDPSVTAVRASVPLAPGDAATVSVDVANTSDVATDFTLLVEACPKTIGECSTV